MSQGLKKDRVHIRPAQVGDVCLLLEPTQEAEIYQLRQRQTMLQSLFGGIPIQTLHLTCQRLVCGSEMAGDLIARLEDNFGAMAPIAMKALEIETRYISALQTNVLKWRIEVTQALKDFTAIVERGIVETGLQSLYVTGFVSSLVTALKEVPKLEKNDYDRYEELPYHLFTGGKVILSRIDDVNKFDILATIHLGQ